MVSNRGILAGAIVLMMALFPYLGMFENVNGQTPDNVILYSKRDIEIYVFYPNETANKPLTITSSVFFNNPNENSTTVFGLFGSSENVQWGLPAGDENSWFVYFEIWTTKSPQTMLKRYGPFNHTIPPLVNDGLKLEPGVKYEMRCIIHAPPHLSIDSDYAISFEIIPYINRTTRAGGTAIAGKAQVFAIHIIPTLNYYLNIRVYKPDHITPLENAAITVKNERTGVVVKGLQTDQNGFLKFNLLHMGGDNTTLGYAEGDVITVSAEKGHYKGKNQTTVSLKEYIEGEYASDVVIYTKEIKEKQSLSLTTLFVIGLIVVVVIIVAVGILQKKSHGKVEDKEPDREEKKKKE